MSKEVGLLGLIVVALFGFAYIISTGKTTESKADIAEDRNVLLKTDGKVQVPTAYNSVEIGYVRPTIAPYDHEKSGLLDYDETMNPEQYRVAEPDPISQPPTVVIKIDPSYTSYEQQKIADARYEADKVKAGEDEHIAPITTTGKIDIANVMPKIEQEEPIYMRARYGQYTTG